MKESTQLIERFLAGHNKALGTTYSLTEVPDCLDRRNPAVDGVATDAFGSKLAIEHTLLQPYEGYREEMVRLGTVFNPLWQDPIFRLPNHEFVILPTSRCIPTGVDWKEASYLLASWFRKNAADFPRGISKHVVPNMWTT